MRALACSIAFLLWPITGIHGNPIRCVGGDLICRTALYIEENFDVFLFTPPEYGKGGLKDESHFWMSDMEPSILTAPATAHTAVFEIVSPKWFPLQGP